MNQSSSHSNPNDNSNSHNSNNNNKNKNINKNNKNNNTGSSLIAENITKLHSWFAFFQLVLNCRFEIQETILLPRLVQKTTLHREFFADRSKLNSVITQMADALNELHYHGLSLQRLSHALWLNSKLVDVLQSYLQTERDLLCPLLETHFSESEFMEIENLIAFSGGKDKLAVILPFVTHCLSKEDEYKLLKELKLSKLHRLMYRKVWKPAYYNTTGSLLFQVTESSCQLSQSNPSTDFWLTRGAASFIH